MDLAVVSPMPGTSVKSSTLALFNCSKDPKYLIRDFFLTLPTPDKLSIDDLMDDFLAFRFCSYCESMSFVSYLLTKLTKEGLLFMDSVIPPWKCILVKSRLSSDSFRY